MALHVIIAQKVHLFTAQADPARKIWTWSQKELSKHQRLNKLLFIGQQGIGTGSKIQA